MSQILNPAAAFYGCWSIHDLYVSQFEPDPQERAALSRGYYIKAVVGGLFYIIGRFYGEIPDYDSNRNSFWSNFFLTAIYSYGVQAAMNPPGFRESILRGKYLGDLSSNIAYILMANFARNEVMGIPPQGNPIRNLGLILGAYGSLQAFAALQLPHDPLRQRQFLLGACVKIPAAIACAAIAYKLF